MQQRSVMFSLLLVGALGVLYVVARRFVATTDRQSVSLVEAHRTNLVLAAGRWHLTGQTNAFAGFLVDTYEDGTRKSRSAVSNGWLQGGSTGWFTNGQQQVEEFFAAGTSHGLRTKWHSNGQKQSVAPIVHGKIHGVFRRWNESGVLTEEVEMKEGQPDGTSRSYFPSGYVKREVALSNGTVLSEKTWADGEMRGASADGDRSAAPRSN